MRCHICDVIMQEFEVAIEANTGTFKPCAKCRRSSNEALYEMEQDAADAYEEPVEPDVH